MTHLRAVDADFVPNDRHSITVDAITEMERIALTVYMPASVAVRELHKALGDRDPDAVIAACSRLSSAGELARLSAIRIQGGN